MSNSFYMKLLRLFLLMGVIGISLKPFVLLSLPNNVWRFIVFAPFLLLLLLLLIIIIIIIILFLFLFLFLSFFLSWTMNLSTADLRNYWTEFHETWWSYRYMFLVGPKVFSFVVKRVKVIF